MFIVWILTSMLRFKLIVFQSVLVTEPTFVTQYLKSFSDLARASRGVDATERPYAKRRHWWSQISSQPGSIRTETPAVFEDKALPSTNLRNRLGRAFS
jgi:hypothetical protein